MIVQVLGHLRRTVGVQVMGRRADHRVRVEQLAGNQRRVFEVPNPYRDVHALLDEVDAPVVEIQVEANLRMPFAECRNRFAHMPHAEGQRQGDTQRTAQLTMLLLRGRLGFLQIRQDARALLVEALAGLRDVQSARRAPQQLHAKALLEPRDPAADGGLGRIEALGRRREAAVHKY